MDFFVTGYTRSGTTLLSVILNNHSDIHISKKNLVHSLINIGDNYLGAVDFEVQDAFDVNQLLGKSLELDRRWKDAHAAFLEGDSLQLEIQNSCQSIKKDHDVSLLGDKSPGLTYRIPDMNLLFPDAKYICMVRDPRSVVSSHLTRLQDPLLLTAYYWKKFSVYLEYYKKVLGPSRIHFVRYEDLVQDTSATVEKICRFLNIPFETSMIDLERNADLQKGDSYVESQLNQARISTWEEKLKPKTIRSIERMTGDLMKLYGYDLKYPESKRKLNQRDIYREELCAKFNYLRKTRIEGMVDHKVVMRSIPLFSRISYVVKSYLLMIFSSELIQALNAKTKFFNPYTKRF